MAPDPLKDPGERADERGDSWIAKRIVSPDGEAGPILDKTAVIPAHDRDQLIKLIMARNRQELVRWGRRRAGAGRRPVPRRWAGTVPAFSRLTCRCGHPRAEHKHYSARFPRCAQYDCAWFSPRFIDWLRSLLTGNTWPCAACGRRNHPAVPFCTRCLEPREDPAA